MGPIDLIEENWIAFPISPLENEQLDFLDFTSLHQDQSENDVLREK